MKSDMTTLSDIETTIEENWKSTVNEIAKLKDDIADLEKLKSKYEDMMRQARTFEEFGVITKSTVFLNSDEDD